MVFQTCNKRLSCAISFLLIAKDVEIPVDATVFAHTRHHDRECLLNSDGDSIVGLGGLGVALAILLFHKSVTQVNLGHAPSCLVLDLDVLPDFRH